MRKTDPSEARRYPTWSLGNESEAIVEGQLASVAVQARRVKLPPESSERRTEHPPAITSESPSMMRMWFRFAVIPVGTPAQPVPASVDVRRVPKFPAA